MNESACSRRQFGDEGIVLGAAREAKEKCIYAKSAMSIFARVEERKKKRVVRAFFKLKAKYRELETDLKYEFMGMRWNKGRDC